MIIELFSLGVTAETRQANVDSKSALFNGLRYFGPKFQVDGDVPHQPFVHGKIGQ